MCVCVCVCGEQVHFSLELGQFYFEVVLHKIWKEKSFLVSFAIEVNQLLASCWCNRVLHAHFA